MQTGEGGSIFFTERSTISKPCLPPTGQPTHTPQWQCHLRTSVDDRIQTCTWILMVNRKWNSTVPPGSWCYSAEVQTCSCVASQTVACLSGRSRSVRPWGHPPTCPPVYLQQSRLDDGVEGNQEVKELDTHHIVGSVQARIGPVHHHIIHTHMGLRRNLQGV